MWKIAILSITAILLITGGVFAYIQNDNNIQNDINMQNEVIDEVTEDIDLSEEIIEDISVQEETETKEGDNNIEIETPYIPSDNNKQNTSNKVQVSSNNKSAPSEPSAPVETPKQEIKVETQPTQPTHPPVVGGCTTNNNHAIGVGSCGKWYSTKQEGVDDYNKKSTEVEAELRSGKITWEEYMEKCPAGYDYFSCKDCGKWTFSY